MKFKALLPSVAVYFFILMFLGLIVVLFRALWISDPRVSAALIAGAGVLLVGIYNQKKTSEREINARLFLDKKAAYRLYLDMVGDVEKSVKDKKEMPAGELDERMLNFKKELLIWGSFETMEAFIEFQNSTEAGMAEPHNMLLVADKVLGAIRRDLGHDDSEVQKGFFVSFNMIEEDRKAFLEYARNFEQK